MRRDGDKLIIEPVKNRDLLALLDSLSPLDEDFPDIEDPPIEPEDIF